ncbi:LytTR family DNA-binding domain-containing protein [Clostridium sp.]|uniref:LytTR family DNA-binding domain-containing protein n=1 Tax=Clostridium sp. TaxID=1506 RepID=UPI0025B9C2E0|nr:LytTR family DNA-binding domain-containing protein [Clostridium sp.]MCI9069801.1 LytTR family transcriptional regulator [Clostridium sp.]MCI9303100.1 LytTR family transcriptional regulator [Clostridium sp.]
MKLRIELDNQIKENEIIIKCSELSEEITKIQNIIFELISEKKEMIFYKGNTEYYICVDDILFFETEESLIYAHTLNEVYQVKYKLYELEEILPQNFIRISKSTILNINHIYSITRNITSASLVEFKNTHKKVYVSRGYYKVLKLKLLEKRR